MRVGAFVPVHVFGRCLCPIYEIRLLYMISFTINDIILCVYVSMRVYMPDMQNKKMFKKWFYWTIFVFQ